MSSSNNHRLTDRITQLINETYSTRPVNSSDPTPIDITDKIEGPYVMDNGRVLCEQCGNIIRKSYFTSHRRSGACKRAVERLHQRKYTEKHHYSSERHDQTVSEVLELHSNQNT
jgi:hypothetical protein